jgi:8-oxo-dGTP pyrophosphatase MutT (NUDIX family)
MEIERIEAFLSLIRKRLAIHKNPDLAEDVADDNLVHSAVLLPFTYHKNAFKLIFTKRSTALERHKGQVSFPGGMIETSDNTPIETALRETCEEINIKATQVEILGTLPPFDSQTGYFIYPVIGFITNLDGLQGNGDEVEKVFCIPYSWLADPSNSELTDYKTKQGIYRKVWFFKEFEGELLWGITAKITKDFVELIEN